MVLPEQHYAGPVESKQMFHDENGGDHHLPTIVFLGESLQMAALVLRGWHIVRAVHWNRIITD